MLHIFDMTQFYSLRYHQTRSALRETTNRIKSKSKKKTGQRIIWYSSRRNWQT